MANLDLVPLKNNILVDYKLSEVKNQIINRINSLGLDVQKYKFDNEFLNLVCNLAEHLVSKKDKIDKKQLVLEVVSSLIPISEEERFLIGNSIDYIHANGGIKKVSYYKLFKTCFKEWFKRKS